LFVEIFTDSGYDNHPRSIGGHLVQMAGNVGSFMPLIWESKLHSTADMSSGDSEAVQWGRAARAGVKLAAMVERTRVTKVSIIGRTDNDSVRLACQRGSSAKLGLLPKQADVSFKFLCDAGLVPVRVSTIENIADLFTKVLSRVKICYLLKDIYQLDNVVGPDNKLVKRVVKGLLCDLPLVHEDLCPHTGTCDVGPFVAWAMHCKLSLRYAGLNIFDDDGPCSCESETVSRAEFVLYHEEMDEFISRFNDLDVSENTTQQQQQQPVGAYSSGETSCGHCHGWTEENGIMWHFPDCPRYRPQQAHVVNHLPAGYQAVLTGERPWTDPLRSLSPSESSGGISI
jgi:hypothetical protein